MQRKMIKAILLDIAGVLYEGKTVLPGAVEAVASLQRRPAAVRFVTNTSQQSPEQVKQQLEDLGFSVGQDQLYTAPGAVSAYLSDRSMTCHALVHPNLDRVFEPFASATPDAVVVADAGERFNYENMNRAFQYLMQGADLIAIGDNRYFRQGGRMLLDAGPFIRALAYAAGIEPIIIGKPSPAFFQIVIDSVPCTPEQAIMIGDDVTADCEGALRAGLQACLVRTGKYRRGDEARCALPGLTCASDVRQALAGIED
jgi:HAD superfamily hydrolase (TIGR01458 family)